MELTTKKDLKSYVTLGLATDITNYNFEQANALYHDCDLEKIKYSRCNMGVSGALFKDRKTGDLYVITARNSTLAQLF